MNKIKSLTQILLSAYLIRLLFTGSSIGDAFTILSLTSLNGFWLYLENQKEPKQLNDLKNTIVSLEDRLNKAEGKVGALFLNNQRR